MDLGKIYKICNMICDNIYFRNVLSSVKASNVKCSDAINLKNNINNILIFFHLYWLDIKQVLYVLIILYYFCKIGIKVI